MANVIKPKRSNTAAKVPTTTDLSSGEFGVNMADQKSYINNGTSVVQVGAGKLVGLQDVTVTSPTSGQTLSWNGTAWVNATGGSGSVTSVTATSPVASTGGTTPVISMPAATTSVSGYLTSTDWNTFNNKGSGTVTSVTGTAPVVSSGGTTPAISMAAANTTTNGYLTSTDWNTFNGKGSGTVTSIGGTGTVAGITLTGTVTSSGSLTLGGTFALPSGQVPGKMIYDNFTATASQTSFTTSNTYTASKIDVFCNGIKMVNGTDVTVTSGTAVVFATGLAVGTLVNVVYPI